MGLTPQSNSPLSEVTRDVRSKVIQHTVDDVKQYYQDFTQAYLDTFGETFQGSRPSSTDELLRYIFKAARLKDGQNILDAGCGVCGPAVAFAKMSDLEIEAITLSPLQLEQARHRIQTQSLKGRVNVRIGDFHHLQNLYPSNFFDRVLFLESICHAEDYRGTLAQAHAVLKPGGLIYIKDYYAIDHRARPELIDLQLNDLQLLNDLCRLVMPGLPDIIDIISEIGFDLRFIRKPTYAEDLSTWGRFLDHTKLQWPITSGYAISSLEILAAKL